MKTRPVAGTLGLTVVLASLVLTQCRRETPPPEAGTAPGVRQDPAQTLDPWSFHFVGGLLVLTGETADTTTVILKGTTLNETRVLPLGPVRWELLRPPPGEVAELRTAEGKLLMRFAFDQPPPPRSLPPAPVPIPQAAPAKPQPPPPPAKPVAEPLRPPQAGSSRPARGLVSPAVPPVPARPKATLKAPPTVAGPKQVRPAAGAMPPRPVPTLVPPPIPPQTANKRAAMAQPPPQLPLRPLVSPSPPSPPTPIPPGPARPGAPGPVRPAPEAVPPPRPATPSPVLDLSAWPGAGEGLNLLRGPKGERRICMTFDGGSSAEVATEVLDALKLHGIRTTLFLTGEFIRKYPELVKRMDREGHELGNHTLNHPHLAPNMKRDPRWTRERFQQELLEADRALFKLLGHPFDPYWRAPYGEQTRELRVWAEELGYRHVGWSEGADTLDWATTKERRLYRTGDAILDRLHARMEKQDGDGLIVLMHLGSGRPEGDRPGQVLGPFLDRAIRDGWHFVAIGDYVKGLGKPRWEPVRRVALLR